jgi:hypothetical protein
VIIIGVHFEGGFGPMLCLKRDRLITLNGNKNDVFKEADELGKNVITCGLYYKQVMIVIYDRNDIGLYYKTRDDRN